MPLLKVNDDESIGQSTAIYLYLALENDLAGDSHFQTAQILSIFEHVKEMTTAYRNLVPAGTEPTSDALHQWFHDGAKDVTGTADSSLRSSRYSHWWMGRIEQALDHSGYAVGNKLSAADIALYYSFAEELKSNEASESFPQWRREPFGSKALVDEALKNYPKIKASVEAVAKNVNFQKWLDLRGPQGF
jgi:glutathione S-transferase